MNVIESFKKHQEQPKLTLSRDQIKFVVDDLVQKEMNKINADNLDIFLHLLCTAGESEFGFKKGRLLRLIERIQSEYEAVKKGYNTKEAVKKYVRDELKINMEVKHD